MSLHFIIGFGFLENASIESFESALSKLPKLEYYSGICVPEDKIAHEALCAFAKKLMLPIYGVKMEAIVNTITHTQSAKIIDRWAALRPRARSRSLVLGHHPVRRDAFIANGGFKIGFGMAPGLAKIMAAFMLEGRNEIPDAFHPKTCF